MKKLLCIAALLSFSSLSYAYTDDLAKYQKLLENAEAKLKVNRMFEAASEQVIIDSARLDTNKTDSRVYVQITVKNNSNYTVYGFGTEYTFVSQSKDKKGTLSGNSSSYQLNPGESITLKDSLFPYGVRQEQDVSNLNTKLYFVRFKNTDREKGEKSDYVIENGKAKDSKQLVESIERFKEKIKVLSNNLDN